MKKPETAREYFDLFSRLMKESCPEGVEEADEELRAEGMNPDVAAHAAAILKRPTEEHRKRAADEREQFRQSLSCTL